MSITLITAVFILPFMAEWFAALSGSTVDQTNTKRSNAFYLLVPFMGLLVYGGFAAITGRELLALAGSLLFYGGLTAVSNKKYEILRDPFNAHDFDNLRNLYIYPEFYVSYVGWPILLLVIFAFITSIGAALWQETPFAIYDNVPLYLGWPIGLLFWFTVLIALGKIINLFFNEHTIAKYGVTTDLKRDVSRFGLFPTVLLYRLLLKAKNDKQELRNRQIEITANSATPADIIAIQGESYFDLERLFSLLPDNKKTAWKPLRALEQEGISTGNIKVPAWGAYTMQTEFSFLSGIPNDALGVDRINPYMRFAQKPLSTMVSALKNAGYHTICVHPAKKEFFRRASVMPNLGFDKFIGLETFDGASHYGKYIADSALAEEIEHIIAGHHAIRKEPLFIFAITIESHGPWAPGRLADQLDEEALVAENPTNDHAFALYQQHMENLLALYKRLSTDAGKTALQTPRTVAMYGDHMPALGELFEEHGFNEIPVDYLLWSNTHRVQNQGKIAIEDFAETVLKTAGLSLQKPT